MGWRGRRKGRYPGNGPFSHLPPWQRPRWIYGYSRGYGSVDHSMCRSFSWLPRWWWARPESVEDKDILFPPKPTPEQEKQFLEERARFLEDELESIKDRIEELRKNK